MSLIKEKGGSVLVKNPRRMSMLIVTPLVGLILGLTVTTTSAYAAAVPSAAPGPNVNASISSSQPLYTPAPAAAAPDAASCKPNEAFRFLACGRTGFTDTFLVNKKVVGHITFLVEQTDVLAVKSTTVTESDVIYDIKVSGETVPTAVSLTATCGKDCTGSSHAPAALVEGASYHFDLHFVNSIAKGAVRFNAPTYHWGFSSGGADTTGGLQWRCDDKLNERAGWFTRSLSRPSPAWPG